MTRQTAKTPDIADASITASKFSTAAVTAKLQALLAESNLKGRFIDDAITDGPNPDMGYFQDSNLAGYYTDGVTDKNIYNSRILSNSNTTPGSLRTTTAGYYQVYLNGQWNNIVVNFRLREDSPFGYPFEHQPVTGGFWIEIMSGNSLNDVGINGLPLVQGYAISMGAYPALPVVNGGIF